jgi:hypothetical protein
MSHTLDTLQRDTALDCEPGVIRLFGAADIGNRGMVSGWSSPEEGHTWNDGIEAIYCISVRPPLARFGLIVTGEPYVTRARPAQELTLFGNGWRIAAWRMTARIDTALTVTLEPEWWFTRGSRSVMRLLFYLPNSARPKDLNDGQDGREIGFCFRSICLRQIPH